ncbi:LOW QUALITY PROTEIN: spore cortex biosynthesis protein [Geomicrobium sp. JCM 19037]|uniref:spore cortex biosynthesis protein YabQ n=1 Tax=Geomicrobium sp. JSM 1781026 TaxID=3344580 RepID=UPI00045F420E|nr:LOW QUALITY PROTEIN: spore cortex biosynthesis protein [Geomicrobium sp. JCM 19037]
MTLAIQFQTFLAMLAAGSFIAIQLDVYHRLLPQRARSKWPQAILDLGFWIVQAVLVFYVLFNMNDGELRIYIFIAILFGFWVYWLTFRPVFLQLLEGIITVVDGIYRFIRKVFYLFLWLPVVWLYQGIVHLLNFILTVLHWIVVQLSKILFFFLRPIYELVQGPKIVNKVKTSSKRIYRWFSPKGDDEDER